MKICYSVPPSTLVLTMQTVMVRNNEHMLSSLQDHTSRPLIPFPLPPSVFITMVITVAIQRMCQSMDEGYISSEEDKG